MYIALRPRDGLTIKDPRGFNVGGGVQARSVEWPLPSTIAGATRTAVGFASGYSANPDDLGRKRWQALKTSVRVAGPFPIHIDSNAKWSLLWPTPRDALLFLEKGAREPQLEWLSPEPATGARAAWGKEDGEVDAVEALWRAPVSDRRKPLEMPLWWGSDDFLGWLAFPGKSRAPRRAPEPVRRFEMHLQVNPDSYTAADGQLFGHDTMEYLRTEQVRDPRREVRVDEIAVGVGVSCEPGLQVPVNELWRVGGEARLARSESAADTIFAFPSGAFDDWKPSRRFRLVLVTPAVFETGWRPKWLCPDPNPGGAARCFKGTIPGTEIEVVLRAAMVGRPLVASGWDFEKRCPKPSRRLVPPGATYFFETTDPQRLIDSGDLEKLWLHSLQEQNSEAACDGFGVAVPGAWPP